MAPPKTAVLAAEPFKGDSFPVYVLHRVTRPVSVQAISNEGPLTRNIDACKITTQECHQTTQSTHIGSVATDGLVSGASLPKRGPDRTNCDSQLALNRRKTTQAALARSTSKQPRPSLSEQLQLISQGAQEVTAQLRNAYQLQHTSTTANNITRTSGSTCDIGLEATTINIIVGKLECRFPCPVYFRHDRCSYIFQHPYETKEIHMIMYYHDMVDVGVHVQEKCFRFRIPHNLDQFGDDYKPSNLQHCIRIVFATVSETQKVKRFVNDHKSYFACIAK